MESGGFKSSFEWHTRWNRAAARSTVGFGWLTRWNRAVAKGALDGTRDGIARQRRGVTAGVMAAGEFEGYMG